MAITVGDAVLKLGVDTRDLDKGMKGLGDRIKKHQKAIGLGMVAAGGAILAAGALSIKTFAAMGDEVQKMALRTGFSTEALSELRHAAQISGASLQTLEKGVKRMSGTILDAQDGLETYVRSFRHLGIEVEELEGMNPEEQFLRIAEAIAEVDDATRRAALAQDIFGRAGTELLPLFAAGKAGLADLREEAHNLGIVFDQEAANKAAEFTDAMTRMNESTQGLKFAVAGQLIPALMPLIDNLTTIIKRVSAWTKEHPELTKVIVLGTTALGGLLIVLGSILLILPGITKGVVILRGAMVPLIAKVWALVAAKAALLGLVTLLVAGVALLAYGILNLWRSMTGRRVEDTFFGQLKVDLQKVTGLVSEATGEVLGFNTALAAGTEGWKQYGGAIEDSNDALATGIAELGNLETAIKKATQARAIPGGGWLGIGPGTFRGALPELPGARQLASGQWVGTDQYGRVQLSAPAGTNAAAQAAIGAGLAAARGAGFGVPAGAGNAPAGGWPGLQEGGIVRRPILARVAEKKPEAVIPLDRLGSLMGGRAVNIFVELDGRVLAQAIGEPLVDEIRLRTGVRI